MVNTNASLLTDGDAAQMLEGLRRKHSALRDQGIQILGTVKRLEQDVAESEASATEQFGTSEVDELRKIVTAAREANARALDEFKANLDSVEEGLAKLARTMEETPSTGMGRRV